jgi:GTP-binding protein
MLNPITRMATTFIKSLTDLKDFPKSDKPQIAMLGRSNVGKSSLLNQLTGQKNLARVSSTPGRTQTINLFDVENRYLLVDLPGYGYAKASKTKRVAFEGMINDYLSGNPNLRLALVIVDARLGPTDIDRELMDYLRECGIAFAVIANKIDKLNQSEFSALKRKLETDLPGVTAIAHSNVSGKGRGQIMEAIEQALSGRG